jgi:hypothetical protein
MVEGSKNESWWKYALLGGSVITASAIGYYIWTTKKVETFQEVDPTGKITNQQIFDLYNKNSKE